MTILVQILMFGSYTSKCNDNENFGSLLYESFSFGGYKNEKVLQSRDLPCANYARLCIVAYRLYICRFMKVPVELCIV